MSVALCVNIGNRDVTYNSNYIENPRPDGERLFKRLTKDPQTSTAFDFPILKPIIENLTRIHSIDHLFLFATDQQDEKFRQKDTIFFAEIIKTILRRDYSKKVKQISILPITASPNDYDLMLQTYGRELLAIDKQYQFQSIYLGVAGGTPACNFSLIFKASLIFGERAHALYTSEKEGLKSLEIAEYIHTELLHHTCQTLLNRYEFHSLETILKKHPLQCPLAISLCHYWADRLNFDFSSALEAIEPIRKSLSQLPKEHRKTIEQIIEQHTGKGLEPWLQTAHKELTLLNQDVTPPNHNSNKEDWSNWLQIHEALLVELLMSLRVQWENSNYTFFLGLIHRFTEAVLRFLFEKETQFSADTKKYETEFTSYLATETGKGCDQFLTAKGIKKWLNNLTLLTWLEWYTQETNSPRLQQIHTILSRLQQLTELRNKSILGHGYQSVTREKIEKVYRIQDILTDLETILTCLAIPYQQNYLKCTQEIIREELNRY